MAERGNFLYRAFDRYIGVPLTVFGAIFRKCGGLFRKPPEQVRSVGVICLGAIGDLLLTSGLINGLRKKFPHAEITMITTMGNFAAVSLLGGINSVRSYPLSKIAGLILAARRAKYDLLIDTTQWARVGSLICAFSGARRTVGFRTIGQARSLPYDVRVTHVKTRHEWINFLELARALYPDVDGSPSLSVPEAVPLKAIELLPKSKFIVCHMWGQGSHRKEKEWGQAKWALLTQYLLEKGYGVVFSGSQADQKKTEVFLDQFFPPDRFGIFNIAGKLSLQELAWYISQADAVISVNTGIMHLAALCGIRTIGLHGPSNPFRWGPVGKCALAVTHSGVTEFPDMEFRKTADDSSFTCHIEVHEVVEALEKLIR